MSEIKINIPEVLDGKKPYMGMLFIDSYGDKLLKTLKLADIDPKNPDGDHFDNYFTVCEHCKMPVVDSSIVPNTGGCCDHCCVQGTCEICKKSIIEDEVWHKTAFGMVHTACHQAPISKLTLEQLCAVENEDYSEMCIRLMDNCMRQNDNVCGMCIIDEMCTLHKHSRQPENQEGYTMAHEEVLAKASLTERIAVARQEAEDAFWAVIVKHFPEANDGSFLMSDMDDIMLSWVEHWVDCNVPKPAANQSYRGEGADELDKLHLHYRDTWHLMHTGGGCMVALTDNVAVAGNHNYMGVTGDCICIYTDTFNQDDFLMEPIATWTFGDNPTVLMNQIDEFMGGIGYWDTGKLFDDIMTLAKSNLTM